MYPPLSRTYDRYNDTRAGNQWGWGLRERCVSSKQHGRYMMLHHVELLFQPRVVHVSIRCYCLEDYLLSIQLGKIKGQVCSRKWRVHELKILMTKCPSPVSDGFHVSNAQPINFDSWRNDPSPSLGKCIHSLPPSRVGDGSKIGSRDGRGSRTILPENEYDPKMKGNCDKSKAPQILSHKCQEAFSILVPPWWGGLWSREHLKYSHRRNRSTASKKRLPVQGFFVILYKAFYSPLRVDCTKQIKPRTQKERRKQGFTSEANPTTAPPPPPHHLTVKTKPMPIQLNLARATITTCRNHIAASTSVVRSSLGASRKIRPRIIRLGPRNYWNLGSQRSGFIYFFGTLSDWSARTPWKPKTWKMDVGLCLVGPIATWIPQGV